jgi:hypothetical protein
MTRGDGKYRVWRECGRKTRFVDEHEANRRADEYNLRAYLCEHCDGYHLSHLASSVPDRLVRRYAATVMPLEVAERKLEEAEKILAHFQAMKRAGKQFPAKLLTDAQTAVENARKERDAARDGGRR